MPFSVRKKALRNAYPFGARTNAPYRAWLKAQRAYLNRHDPTPAGRLLALLEPPPKGKESRFVRRANDFYPTTDPAAVAALSPFLPSRTRFFESCAGAGDLVRQISDLGHICLDTFDISPGCPVVRQYDALQWAGSDDSETVVITNPPYTWAILRQLIQHFLLHVAATWLLLEADFAHNLRSAPFMRHCCMIVSVGRLKWEQGTRHKSSKNYTWFLFTRSDDALPTFYPRG